MLQALQTFTVCTVRVYHFIECELLYGSLNCFCFRFVAVTLEGDLFHRRTSNTSNRGLAAVNSNVVSVLELLSGILTPDDGGDSILSGANSGMREHTTVISDNAGAESKNNVERSRTRVGDDYVALPDLLEVAVSRDHAHWSLGDTHGCGDTLHRVVSEVNWIILSFIPDPLNQARENGPHRASDVRRELHWVRRGGGVPSARGIKLGSVE